MCAFVLVDPVSCGGHQSRRWRLLEPELAKLYPFMSPTFPKRRTEMAGLVSAALRDGHTEIVAVGGTLDEAVNGFFNAEGSLSPDAVLAVLAPGKEGIARLSKAAVRPIDIGRACYLSRDGKPRTRYFTATASFGPMRLSDGLNNSVVANLFAHRGQTVRLIVDPSFDDIVRVGAVSITSGQVFGTTNTFRSGARLDDGRFDVAIRLRGGPRADGLHQLRGHKIVAAPVEQTHQQAVVVALDGQSCGRLPATFEILPRALNVRC